MDMLKTCIWLSVDCTLQCYIETSAIYRGHSGAERFFFYNWTIFLTKDVIIEGKF